MNLGVRHPCGAGPAGGVARPLEQSGSTGPEPLRRQRHPRVLRPDARFFRVSVLCFGGVVFFFLAEPSGKEHHAECS